MAKENESPKTGVNVDAVRAYMLSQDGSIPEAIERLTTQPDRVNLEDRILPSTEEISN